MKTQRKRYQYRKGQPPKKGYFVLYNGARKTMKVHGTIISKKIFNIFILVLMPSIGSPYVYLLKSI
jgi:ribosomal protein S6E (S10)